MAKRKSKARELCESVGREIATERKLRQTELDSRDLLPKLEPEQPQIDSRSLLPEVGL